jgi:hypothetical protein
MPIGDRTGSRVAAGALTPLDESFCVRDCCAGAGAGAGAGFGAERVNTVRTRCHNDSVRRIASVADPRLSARENSAADANRSFASFAIARTSAQLTCSGTSGREARALGTGSIEWRISIWRIEPPVYGGLPVSISYTTQARLY